MWGFFQKNIKIHQEICVFMIKMWKNTKNCMHLKKKMWKNIRNCAFYKQKLRNTKKCKFFFVKMLKNAYFSQTNTLFLVDEINGIKILIILMYNTSM